MESLPDSGAVQDLVVCAAHEELEPRLNGVTRHYKHDGSIVTEGDLAMHRRLEKELRGLWPEISFLSEETPHAKCHELLRETSDAFWCLDPLDGTNNFAAGLPFFAVSLALIHRRQPVVGIIYDPIRDERFRAEKDRGAWLNGRPLKPDVNIDQLRQAIALVDYKRLAPELSLRLIRERPYASQRNFGSCALEWAWIAAGRAHVYLHGGQQLWDCAAGTVILTEAGGFSCTLDGEPVFEPTEEPRSVVASADPDLFVSWRNWLGV